MPITVHMDIGGRTIFKGGGQILKVKNGASVPIKTGADAGGVSEEGFTPSEI